MEMSKELKEAYEREMKKVRESCSGWDRVSPVDHSSQRIESKSKEKYPQPAKLG